MPAFLTYSVLAEQEEASDTASPHAMAQKLAEQVLSANAIRRGSQEFTNFFSGIEIPLPALTRAERDSPLGIWFGHTISLLYSMTHYIIRQRMKEAERHAQSLGDAKGADSERYGLGAEAEGGKAGIGNLSTRSSITRSGDVADAAAAVAADAADLYYHQTLCPFPPDLNRSKWRTLDEKEKQAAPELPKITLQATTGVYDLKHPQSGCQAKSEKSCEYRFQSYQEPSLPDQLCPQSQQPSILTQQFQLWQSSQNQTRNDAGSLSGEVSPFMQGQLFHHGERATNDGVNRRVNHSTYLSQLDIFGDFTQPAALDAFDDESDSYAESV